MGGNRGASAFTYISLTLILAMIVLITGNIMLIPVFAGILVVAGVILYFSPLLRRSVSTNINLMMTMVIGGLWHGASLMFVIWGGLNGIGLVVYKMWRKISPWESSNHWAVSIWKIFLTFTFVTFTRIWFRSETMQGAADMLYQITWNFGWAEIPVMVIAYHNALAIMVLGFTLHWLSGSVKERAMNLFIDIPIYLQAVFSIAVVFVIYQSISAGLQPFIYFRF
jgi:hypothetical protein